MRVIGKILLTLVLSFVCSFLTIAGIIAWIAVEQRLHAGRPVGYFFPITLGMLSGAIGAFLATLRVGLKGSAQRVYISLWSVVWLIVLLVAFGQASFYR